MRNSLDAIGVLAGHDYHSPCVGQSLVAEILEHLCRLIRIVLLMALGSFAMRAESRPLSQTVALPVVEGNDIRFTQLLSPGPISR